ncbi:MAG: ATP-binding protein [Nitrospirae bacterium]|nr:ATP-binding protein [Nitrospirota bacterium]
MFTLLENIPLEYPIYLFYGGAFFLLGVSIALKNMESSDLQLAGNLWLLGMFGFTHGAHEWLELYELMGGERLSQQEISTLALITAFMTVLSFFFLLRFGLSLIGTTLRRIRPMKLFSTGLFLAWLLFLFHRGFSPGVDFLKGAELIGRNIFGLAGALAAAYGLIAYSREIKDLSGPGSLQLRHAGIIFIFYGVFAGVIHSHYSLPVVGVPVEILRGLSAVLITYFIIKAMTIFEVEAQKKLAYQLLRLGQSEKLQSLGQLAAGIAHEINNPLANAVLGIQTARKRVTGTALPDQQVIERLDAVEKNIDRASIIARELLQFSRQRDAEAVPFNVNDVVRGALTLMKYRLRDTVIHHDLGPVREVTGDLSKMEQVFINLLSNAADAMPEGGDIFITTGLQGDDVEIRISDTGSGIPPENLSRVFDPFFTTKETGSGTGLGLSICYGIVKQHRGTIEIDSTGGKGTTVTVRLPAGGAS